MTDFQLEKDMTPIVRKWLEDQGYIVRPEMVTANNCDLMGCMFNMDNVRLRIKMREKTPLTAQFYNPWKRDRSAVLGIVHRPIEPREWMPLASHIIAVELKLSRIAAVINQAKSHKRYARSSYIAMPLDTARHAIGMAQRYGVGVLGVTPQGVEMLCQAADNKIKNDNWGSETIAEVFWRYHRKELKLGQ